MYVLKRDNRQEKVQLDKITSRLAALCDGLAGVDPARVAILTVGGLYEAIRTSDIDVIAAKQAEQLKLEHSNYRKLAGRIVISNMHKMTPPAFSICMAAAYACGAPLRPEIMQFIAENASRLDEMIVDDRDYLIDYFGYSTLKNSYLFKNRRAQSGSAGELCDRPQYMYMRVALCLYWPELEAVQKAYDDLSLQLYTHATPTLFNACCTTQQIASCFLLGTQDSCAGIMHNLTSASIISKWAGGIGIHMSNVRAAGSLIKGTNGISNGLVPQIAMYNAAANCWDQGGDKRKAAIAIYLELHHADIMRFVRLRMPTGHDADRSTSLLYAVWASDLFYERFSNNDWWSLFSPDTAPGLDEVYGAEYNELYARYEREGRAVKRIMARELADAIFESQAQCGVPFVLWKDSINCKSNQVNRGIIKSSNLCTEIVQYSSHDSYASCNLASINLPKFVKPDRSGYDLQALHETTKTVVANLDRLIDVTTYPVPECIENNSTLRPIGVGVQGLADVFCMLRMPFVSPEAESLDKSIFETIYHAALESSCELAKERGIYDYFEGSPVSQGVLQFDMWQKDLENSGLWEAARPSIYDWGAMRLNCQSGIRNSLLVALMPTVSTSQILGNNESFEPFPNNIYIKSTMNGKFLVTNSHMIEHLIELGLWTGAIRKKIYEAEGSIQNIDSIPQHIREIYKTVWEIPQRHLMRRAAIRGACVCQSASLNIYMKEVKLDKLRGIFVLGKKLGLKTGNYYVRSTAATSSFKNNRELEAEVCDMDDQCTSCSA